jgi:trans-aconitate methyltransferase
MLTVRAPPHSTARKGLAMRTKESTERAARYALGYTAQEYERLRAQARVWELAAARVLDQVGLPAGARCLDAGCGPGETMRLLAERVGEEGRVLGIDADRSIGALAVEMLERSGHRHTAFSPHDLTSSEPIPGAPFDVVYARLVLFHLPKRVAVLTRLWEAVAPGGHLVVQDYDLRSVSVLPDLASVEEIGRVIFGAFAGAGADVQTGARLGQLFAQAGIGIPDGTDVAGRIEPLGTGSLMLKSVFRSLLPGALAHGVTTEEAAAATLAAIDRDAAEYPDRPMLWPLMISAWKRKGR